MTASVLGVHRSRTHSFSKPTVDEIELVEGFGVAGDAHAGATVQHVSRVKRDPSTPNLRQVHLLHAELFDDLAVAGFHVEPGQMGENLTTTGLDILSLPVGTRLSIGDAVITVMGLRNPCHQINGLQEGLMKQVLRTDESGEIERLAGVMGVVSRGGVIRPGDEIVVDLPPEPHHRLAPV
ncbi:MOSC domain-containing protein [Paramicrobacterium sp. CJ85]|uniref:MOSC domain-containing protein n=1 Tax=Paramicrobacterium sp. CJ85 TaxID=3445355 RepID=UPI003F61E501